MKMNTLQGIFDTRPRSKRNFIHENVKQLRTIQKPCTNKDVNATLPRKSNKFKHIAARVPAHVTVSSMTSKQRDLSSSHESERTKSSDYLSRRSILSSLSAVRRSELRGISSDLGSQSKPILVGRSQVCPAPSNGQENNISKKPKKHSSTSSLNNTNSAIKALSALSLSRSPTESPNLETEAVQRTLSEKSQFNAPPEKTVHNSAPVTNGHHNFSEKSAPSEFSEKYVSRVPSENSVSLQPFRTVGCQTVMPGDSEGMFNEGVIKYPSSYILEPMRTESSSWMARLPTRDSCQQTDTSPVKFPPLVRERSKTHLNPIPIDDVITYKSIVKKDQLSQPLHEQLSHRFESRIDIPKDQNFCLLARRNNNPKVEHSKEILNDIKKQNVDYNGKSLLSHDIFDSSVPLDHAPLSESERLETLRKLQKSYEDHIRQLNSLPVKTDTLKMRLRKIDIEKQLSKLEEGIKIFSRPRVFIKVGV